MTNLDGFAMIPRSVLHSDQLSAYAKLAYLAISSHVDGRLRSYPSVRLIAATASCSVRTAAKALDELEHHRLITRTGQRRADGGKTSNLYVLGSAPSGDPHAQLVPMGGGAGAAHPHAQELRNSNETHKERDAATQLSPAAPEDASAAATFEELWKLWPRHADKKLARERFMRLRRSIPDLAERIRAHAAAYAEWSKADEQYIPHLSSWLSRKVEDPVPGPRSEAAAKPGAVDQGRAALEELARRRAAAESGRELEA